MAIKFHKAITDEGGAIGDELKSGDVATFFPTLSKIDLLTGITTFRKLYTANDSQQVSIQFGVEDGGEFDLVAIFQSTGDAQVVGDLTGLETKYGATIITKAIDTLANFETVNGTGGLINIKKIIVPKIGSYVLYRTGEFVYFADRAGKIQAVTDLGAEYEIEIETAVSYAHTIGRYASTQVHTTVPTSGHSSFWIEQYVAPNQDTIANYNSIKLLIDY